jgi:phage shock protein A
MTAGEAAGFFGRLWKLARTVEDLLQLQTQTREALEVIDERLRALENRMTRLEANQEQLVVQAQAAAGAAATALAGAVISDTVTRLTRLEEREKRLSAADTRARLEAGTGGPSAQER